MTNYEEPKQTTSIYDSNGWISSGTTITTAGTTGGPYTINTGPYVVEINDDYAKAMKEAIQRVTTKEERFNEIVDAWQDDELRTKLLKLEIIEKVLRHHQQSTDQQRILSDIESLWKFVNSK